MAIYTNPEDLEKMRVASRLAAEVLDYIAPYVQPGVTTEELDRLCHDYMVNVQGTIPAPLNYTGGGSRPYPKSICTSVNHVVCHGIPAPKKLKKGDILNIDITVIYDGWYGDSSRMYAAGKMDRKSQRLVDVTYESLMIGIEQVKPGNTFGDIGHAIQEYVESNHMSVVRDFCGHGVGRMFHGAPNVLHYGKPGHGAVLEPGMIFTIEPMVNLGRPEVKVLADGWTAVTRDRSLTAQYEHSVGVTEDGCVIFTDSPKDMFYKTWA